MKIERQITDAAHGHILTNVGVWSSDGEWIVYDVRSDPAGDVFDGTRIERVHVDSGRVETLFQARNGACCGVATYHPREERVIFILGPENPTVDRKYCAWNRRGVVVETARPDIALNLDACDLVPPFTPGALRGGSHLHVWSPNAELVSLTYEDQILALADRSDGPPIEKNQRNVGVSFFDRAVTVPPTHPGNHDGIAFTVLVTKTMDRPRPGTYEISRACEEAWIGEHGYLDRAGIRRRHALAFQGTVLGVDDREHAEVFVVDLPDDPTSAGDGPLCGTTTTRPNVPAGTIQRRLTWTDERRFPGISGPRHWLRSSPDGEWIGFLMRDDFGTSQFRVVSPNGGESRQVTTGTPGIGSAFTWTPDGRGIVHDWEGEPALTLIETRRTIRLTAATMHGPMRPEACVVSPHGDRVAYVRPVERNCRTWNQIFVVELS